MTKTEQAELQELGLTEAQIEQRAREISNRLRGEQNVMRDNTTLEQERARIAANPYVIDNVKLNTPKPTRKRRIDAGKPKARKAEAVPGVLTSEQVDELERRIANMMRTRSRKEIAIVECEAAQTAYESFIKLLAGKDAQ